MNAIPVPTPLYSVPEGMRWPLRVVLAVPPQVPSWVRAFQALAEECAWIEPIALVDSELALPAVAQVALDVRAFVAVEHALLGSSRSLEPTPMPTASAQAAQTPLAKRVEALAPDLVILFGDGDAQAAALAGHAAFGCWKVDASLVDARHAGLSLLGPMVRAETATQTALALQDPGQGTIDLAASWGRTRATSFLVQREDAFRKLPALLLRSLHRLAAGRVCTQPRAVATLQLRPPSPTGRAIGLRAFASTLRASPRWLMGWRRNGRIGWTVVLRLGATPLDPEAPVIGTHALLKAPQGWWGDPCVVISEGRRLIFVEEMPDPRAKKARIACLELVNGGARRLGPVLDERGHLSFPQVFDWQGRWYMTVESGYDRRVSLYRADEFPLKWRRTCDLIAGRVCVDPTLHHHGGHWYLFVNVAENCNSTCDELFLFVAERLEGPYRPHPLSPIVCDVRRARMAGRLFQRNGRLVRPSQDCAPGYGNAVVFNEVLELGPTTYREHPLARLAPHLTRSMDGCHTYNADHGIELLDVLGRPPSGTYLQLFDPAGAEIPHGEVHVPNRFVASGPGHPDAPSR